MNTSTIVNYANYYPIGDIIVIALSILILFLFMETFINKNKNFRIFQIMAVMVSFAAVCSLLYHQLVNVAPDENVLFILFLYNVYHILLYFTMYAYIYYMIELLSISGSTRRKFFYIMGCGTILFSVLQVLSTVLKKGFYWEEGKGFVESGHLFIYAYLFHIGLLLYLLMNSININDINKAEISEATNKAVKFIFKLIILCQNESSGCVHIKYI